MLRFAQDCTDHVYDASAPVCNFGKCIHDWVSCRLVGQANFLGSNNPTHIQKIEVKKNV